MANSTQCAIQGCGDRMYGRGWCLFHYKRWHKTGSPHRLCKGCGAELPATVKTHCSAACKPLCSIDGCGKTVSSKGWCKTHYERNRKWGTTVLMPNNCVTCGSDFDADPSARWVKFCSVDCKPRCSIDGCERPAQSHGWCTMHYRRYETHGTPTPSGVMEWATEWVCLVCGVEVEKGSGRRAHCSGRCQVLWAKYGEQIERTKACAKCGCDIDMFKGSTPNRKRRTDVALCTGCKRRDNRPVRKQLADLFIRDFLICGICDKAVDPDIPWPAHQSATVDHIMPVAHGGTDHIDNLQIAHLTCNTRKQDRVDFKIA